MATEYVQEHIWICLGTYFGLCYCGDDAVVGIVATLSPPGRRVKKSSI
jgi:hypothetical protein